MRVLALLVIAGILWTGTWVFIDLRYGGLIEADFSTAGLQQAYSQALYFVGWAFIFMIWGIVHTIRALTRRFANRKGSIPSRESPSDRPAKIPA